MINRCKKKFWKKDPHLPSFLFFFWLFSSLIPFPIILHKIFGTSDEVRGAKRRNLLKPLAFLRSPRLLIFDCSALSLVLSPSPLSFSASPTSGFLTGSQSLKKFFFEARPLESNINQITPSRTPLALPPLHSCYSSFFPVDSLAVLSSAYRLR